MPRPESNDAKPTTSPTHSSVETDLNYLEPDPTPSNPKVAGSEGPKGSNDKAAAAPKNHGQHMANTGAATSDDDIVTLNEVVEDGPPLLSTEDIVSPQTAATNPSSFELSGLTPTDDTKADATGTNPFLPQHILDKLSKGRKELEDDIVQSSQALDISAALLRAHARAPDKSAGSAGASQNPFATQTPSSKQKQKLVDDLVDDYLPLLTSELRRRLHQLLE